MSTNYHTAIATGASNNPATVNTPLGLLDQQITTNRADISSLQVATMTSAYATINNGAGEADTSWVIDNISGTFLDGATVVYAVAGVMYASEVAATTGATPLTVTAAPSVALPDNTPIFQVPSGVGGIALQNIYNIKDPGYGATGDGTTDDTAAIQAAIDAAEGGGGGIVYAPPGTYIFTLIENGEECTLMGAGPGATIFKLKNSVADLYATVGLLGIAAKSGISRCAFSSFEIDGNAANNRAWGAGYLAWAANDYDTVAIHGIYSGQVGSRVPADTMVLHNLYIHDTVRNGIAYSADLCTVIASDLHIKNSDADHLIYPAMNAGSTPVPSIYNNILLEGFSRNGMVVGNGQSMNNVSIQNMVANPTIYNTEFLFSIRYSDSPTQINNCYIFLDPSVLDAATTDVLFDVGGPLQTSNIRIFQKAATATGALLSFFNITATDGNIRPIQIRGIAAADMQDFCRLIHINSAANDVLGLSVSDVSLACIGTPAATTALVQLNGDTVGFGLDSWTIANAGPRQFLVSGAGLTVSDGTVSRIRMDAIGTYFVFMESRSDIAVDNCRIPTPSTAVVSASHLGEIKFRGMVVNSASLSENGGSATFDGDGATTQFDITHALWTTPNVVSVIAESGGARALFSITPTSTVIQCKYAVAPAGGTGNVVLRWRAAISA